MGDEPTMILARLIAASSLLVVAACGGDATSTTAGSAAPGAATSAAQPTAKPAAKTPAQTASCDQVKAESLCREYRPENVEAAGVDMLKSTCEGLQGAFKMEGCPKDKRVGACVTPEGTKVFYSEGPLAMDAAQAEKACKEGVPAGEWKAGG